jgi:hypothetical protein
MLRLVLRGEALGQPQGCDYKGSQANDRDGSTDPKDWPNPNLPIIHIKILIPN